MQRRLEVFLTTDELADPDLVEFWLPDQPEADVPHQQAELATGQRPTDASTLEQQLQHCEALELAAHQRNITGALELAAATNDARRKWAEAAAALNGSWAEGVEQQREQTVESEQHRSGIEESDGSSERSMERAVLTGGATVPGHHPRNSVRGLDRIHGSLTQADRKRLCPHTAADGSADGVAMVVTGQVADSTRTEPGTATKRHRVSAITAGAFGRPAAIEHQAADGANEHRAAGERDAADGLFAADNVEQQMVAPGANGRGAADELDAADGANERGAADEHVAADGQGEADERCAGEQLVHILVPTACCGDPSAAESLPEPAPGPFPPRENEQ